jgi:hypothetical protein
MLVIVFPSFRKKENGGMNNLISTLAMGEYKVFATERIAIFSNIECILSPYISFTKVLERQYKIHLAFCKISCLNFIFTRSTKGIKYEVKLENKRIRLL